MSSPPPAPADPEADAGLLQRRVPQAAIAYLAGSWALVEAGAFFVGRYRGPEAALDGLILLLLAGFPATIILTWRHGLPGEQRWKKTELAAAALAFAAVLAAGVAGGVGGRLGSAARRGGRRPRIKAVGPQLDENGRMRLNLKLRATKLGKLVALLAEFYGMNHAVAHDLRAVPVHAKLEDVTLEEALEILSRQTGARLRVRDGLIEAVPAAPAVP